MRNVAAPVGPPVGTQADSAIRRAGDRRTRRNPAGRPNSFPSSNWVTWNWVTWNWVTRNRVTCRARRCGRARLRRRPRRNRGLVGTKNLDVGMGPAGLSGLRNAGRRDDDRPALHGSADILGSDGKRRGNNQACDEGRRHQRDCTHPSAPRTRRTAFRTRGSRGQSNCKRSRFTLSRLHVVSPSRRLGLPRGGDMANGCPANAWPITGQRERTLRRRRLRVDLTGTCAKALRRRCRSPNAPWLCGGRTCPS